MTAGQEWFLPWCTIEGEESAPASMPQLEVLLRGVFEKKRLLNFLRHFIVFEEEKGRGLVKKLAGYHQFHAVGQAVKETFSFTRSFFFCSQSLPPLNDLA